MAKLSFEAARAICCRAWGVTPPEFERLAEAGEISLDEVFLQVDLEITINPRVIEFSNPGITAEYKAKRRDAQNAAAFEAMYHQAMKKNNAKKGVKS